SPIPVTAVMNPGAVPCTINGDGVSTIGPNAGNWPVEAECESATHIAQDYETAVIAKAMGSVAWSQSEFVYDGTTKTISATLVEESLACSVAPPGAFGPNVGNYTRRALCDGGNHTVEGASSEYITARIT